MIVLDVKCKAMTIDGHTIAPPTTVQKTTLIAGTNTTTEPVSREPPETVVSKYSEYL